MEKVVGVGRGEDFDVYIGRAGREREGSKWANPFRIGKDGDRREVLLMYKHYLLHGEGRKLLEDIEELEGKVLGCFCAGVGRLTADDPVRCHGQILLKALAVKKRRRRSNDG